jgi:hypothetical protein
MPRPTSIKIGPNNIRIITHFNPAGPWFDRLEILDRVNNRLLAAYEANVDPKIQEKIGKDYERCDDCGVIANGNYEIFSRGTSAGPWYWGKPLLYVNNGGRVDSLRPNKRGQKGAKFLDQVTIHGKDSPSIGCIMVNAEGANWLALMKNFPIGSKSELELFGKREPRF